MGFVARILDRSGLDETGIGGGGAPLAVSEPGVVPLTPFATLDSCGLFIPYESADLTGNAGGLSGGGFLASPVDSFRIGVCGGLCAGREGRLGGVATSTVVMPGLDLVGFKPILDLSMFL